MEQNVHVPTIVNLKEAGLTPKDLLIYAAIKSYENSATHSCYPSIAAICKQVGATAPTVKKSIEALEKAGLLSQEFRAGTSTIYHFNPYQNFEIFSKEFLESEDLSAMEKAYLISIQNKLFKKPETHQGVTSYTTAELSESLNLGPRVITATDKSLQSKGILQIVKSAAQDSVTGLAKVEKIFDFDKFANAVVFEFNNVYSTIDKTAQHMQVQMDAQQKEIDKLRKALRRQGINPDQIDDIDDAVIL